MKRLFAVFFVKVKESTNDGYVHPHTLISVVTCYQSNSITYIMVANSYISQL